MTYLIGVDVGTQSVRSCLFDLDGAAVASASRPLATTFPKPAWAEQDPEEWWRAAVETLQDVMRSSGVDLTTGRPAVNTDKATAQGKNVKNICPSLEGGKNQQPAAFSPRTGLFYVPTNNLCMDFEGREVTYIAGTPYIGGNAPETGGPGGYKGEFMAWDAVHGRKVWGIKEPFPVWSGVLATAGNVVFYGTFFVSRSVGLIMARRKTGKIINVTSVLSKIAARNMAGYCASKAAVIQLTRVMALELMKDNVQVNAIGPGYIVSDINRKFLESNVGKQLIEQKTPMKRAGTLEEMRSTALYLATCPPFLTGAEISIDGGHTIV